MAVKATRYSIADCGFRIADSRRSAQCKIRIPQSASAMTTPSRGLIRILGVWFGLAVIVGSTLGIGILTLAALAALQLAGLRVSSRFQEITTVVKCGAFLILVVAAMAFAPGIPSGARLTAQTPSMSALVVALQSVVITYGGWQSALYFAEEDRNPDRNLPRAMIGGVASVIVVYLLVNLALLTVLPIADLARSTLP